MRKGLPAREGGHGIPAEGVCEHVGEGRGQVVGLPVGRGDGQDDTGGGVHSGVQEGSGT